MAKRRAADGLNRFALRKQPRQKRSQIVFERIISTAKILFEKEGFAYVSTNQIAAKANASIGSLYQYFANRESIALAVYEEASARAVSLLKRKGLQVRGLPIEQAMPKTVEWLFDAFEQDRYALLQLINEIPSLRRVSQPYSFDNLIYHPTQLWLEQHVADIDQTFLARKAYVINKAVMGVVSGYFEEQPDFLSRTDVITEVTEMILNYVAAGSRKRDPRRTGSR